MAASEFDLLLVRHGQTVATNPNVVYGRKPIALSDAGREQVMELAKRLQRAAEIVYSSPLDRALESAKILAQGVIPLEVDPDLREVDFGELSGEDVTKHPHIFHDKYRSSSHEFPGGESQVKLVARADAFHKRLVERPIGSAIVVSHQWLLNAYLKQLLRCDHERGSNFVFQTGKLTYVRLVRGEPAIVAHNVRSLEGWR